MPPYRNTPNAARRPTLPALLVTLVCVALLLWSPAPLWANGQPWNAQTLDPTALNAAQEATGKVLSALPSSDQADALTNNRRAILERRQALLQDLVAAQQSHAAVTAQADKAAKTQKAGDTKPSDPKTEAADSEAIDADPTADQVTPEGLEALKRKVEAAHTAVNRLSDTLQKNRDRLSQIPELLSKAHQRLDKAKTTRAELGSESGSGASQDLLQLQIENAAIDARTAALTIETLQLEKETLHHQGPHLSAALDSAKTKVAPLEQAFSHYKEILQQRQQDKTDALAREAEHKQQEAEQAASPLARFLAGAEAETAAIERDTAALAGHRTQLSKAMLELENGLKTDQTDLKELQAMITGGGLSDAATELLREVYGDIERRRRQLHEAISPATLEWIRQIPSQIIATQQQLSRLSAEWSQKIAELPAAQTDDPAFEQRATELLEKRRKALYDKAELLRSTSQDGHKLEALPAQRLAVLDDLEDFVTANVLWMQDARPLDDDVFSNAYSELFSDTRPGSLRDWWAGASLSRLSTAVGEVIGHSYAGLVALLLVVVLPLLLWRFNRGSSHPGRPLLRNLVGTMVFPAYLLAIAMLIEPGEQQFYSVLWTNRLLVFLALTLQIWLLSRVFFRPDGIAMRRFGMPAAVAATLRRTLNIWAVTTLLLLVPERVFSSPPFAFSGVPRLLYTAMEVIVVFTLYRLIRPQSPLMTALFSEDSRLQTGSSRRRQQTHRFLGRHWGAISSMITAGLVGIVVLDLLGFRYTAERLSVSVVATVFIIAALLAAYWIIVATMDRLMWQRLTAADAPSASVEHDPRRLRRQVRKGLRAMLALGGTMLIIIAWSSSAGDTLPLQRYKLYSVVANDGTRAFVTLGNLVDFILIVILLLWLLRELKTIFELLIFPHLNMDRGKRYATVTIARYLVFALGIVIALSMLKVDLSSVGWLVAAMGVGLGFGLQEIFANFVSGLILLIERPIRVGDLVTIGNVMGNISHISFRATTVVAFNNEEILVPNKELITGQVTNWTLGNEVTRIIIPIQVAYGSDVDKVSELLLEIAKNDPEVIDAPAPSALFMAHGESGLDFELRVHLGSAGVRLSTRDRLNRKVNRAFTEHGIEIPYPQRDIHIREVNWPTQAPLIQPAPAGPTSGGHPTGTPTGEQPHE